MTSLFLVCIVVEYKHMNISVIIPSLNEENTIGRALSCLGLEEHDEVIVVDGGSSDRTVSVASEFTKNVYTTKRGRGRQLGYGAVKAHGDILLFLHADCSLPDGALTMIRKALNDETVAFGAFDLAIDHSSFCFRVIEAGANLRSRMTRIAYGDQGMFVRKDVYTGIGGFSDIPLMEDIDISKRLKNEGKARFIQPPIKTSPRRWLKEGLLYTTLRDWKIALSYSMLNVRPERLNKQYRDIR